MKRNEYVRYFLANTSNPRLFASAMRDNFKRVYERLVSTANYLLSDDDTVEVNHVIVEVNDNKYKFDTISLKEAIVNSETNDSFQQVECVDLYTNEVVSINLDILSEIFGSMIDTNYITWQAYAALTSNSLDKAENFINNINFSNFRESPSVSAALHYIYNIISDSSATLEEKITIVNEFTGESAFVSGEVNYDNPGIKISDFTGVNPFIAWMDGIAIDLTNILTFTADCINAVGKLFVNILSAVFKGIGNLISTVVGKFITTFVDPIDYTCNEEYLEYFNLPATTVILDDSVNYQDAFTPDDDLYFGVGNVLYHLQPAEFMEFSGGYYSFIRRAERYVKPTNPYTVYQIMKEYDRGSESNPFSSLTYRQLIEMCQRIFNSDSTMFAKDVNEKDVYYGVLTSYTIEKAISSFLQYTNRDGFSDISTNPNTPEVNLDDVIADTDSHWGFEDTLDELQILYRNVSTYLGFNATTSYVNSLQLYHGLQWDNKDSITNADFVKLLTSEWMTTNDGFANWTVIDALTRPNDANSYKGYYFTFNPSMISSVQELIKFEGYNASNYGQQVLTFFGHGCSPSSSPFDFDSFVIPFVKNQPFSINKNIIIKTDKDNAANVSRVLTNITLTLATVAAAYISFKAFKSIRRVMANNQASLISTQLALAKAIETEDTLAINDAQNKYLKQNVKYNILSKFLGSTSGLVSSNNNATTLSLSGYSTHKIAKLIDPSA